MNLWVWFPLQSVTVSVFVAVSCGVSMDAMLAGTNGFAVVTDPGTQAVGSVGKSVKPEKSPVYSEGCGMVFDAIFTGETS